MRRRATYSYLPGDAAPSAPAPFAPLAVTPLLAPWLAQARPRTNQVAASVADVAVGGPAARIDNGVTGTGIKIGILSDSMNILGGAAADIAAGLLPAGGVAILKEGPAGSGDEGRAIAQVLHQTAPGAQLYFYTAFDGAQDFAAGIDALRAAGCQIIVDDVTYPDEPMFQIAGPIDTAVQRAVAAGVDYFTAVGNEGAAFYQSAFIPVSAVVPGINGAQPILAQRFGNGTVGQTIDIPANVPVTLTLEWNAPYAGNNPDSLTVDAMAGSQIAATSVQTGTEPNVFVDLPVRPSDTQYSIVIFQTPGTPVPGVVKYVLEGGGSIADPLSGVGSGSAIGHALVPGANAVGAVDAANTPAQGGTPVPENYSSTGPGQFLLAPDGSPLAAPQTAAVPQFLAPDGTGTSLFNPFFGTSAAAPVAAATAALMLQASPALTTADVTALLRDSAIPAGAASVAGAGLIQASLAVNYARSGMISGSPQPLILGTSLGGTIQGGGGTQTIQAGSGATSVLAPGADTVLAGAGADTVALTGVSGLAIAGSGPLLVRADGVNDTVNGAAGRVTAIGGNGTVTEIGGSAGGNLLVAGAQPSTLIAGGANDTLVGAGLGGDSLFANVGGAATLSGGLSTGGNYFSVGGAGGALVQTGLGNNTVVITSGNDTVQLGGSLPAPSASALTLPDGTQLAFGGMFHPV